MRWKILIHFKKIASGFWPRQLEELMFCSPSPAPGLCLSLEDTTSAPSLASHLYSNILTSLRFLS